MTTEVEKEPSPDEFKIVRSKHVLTIISAIIVLAILGLLVRSIATNSRFGWSVIGQYFFNGTIIKGVEITLLLTFSSMIIGVALGLLLATMRLSRNPVISQSARLYVFLFRGTPVLVQLLIWYNLAALYPRITFGLPFIHLNANTLIKPMVAAILGLGLNEGAYMSEIVRAGIISVAPGQSEASLALGLTHRQSLRKVVLPQAMRVIVPPTGNEFIGMLKSTSLVSVLSVAELLYSAQIIYQENLQIIPLLILASIWYIILTAICGFGQGYIERYYGRGTGSATPMPSYWARMRTYIQRTHAPEALVRLTADPR